MVVTTQLYTENEIHGVFREQDSDKFPEPEWQWEWEVGKSVVSLSPILIILTLNRSLFQTLFG